MNLQTTDNHIHCGKITVSCMSTLFFIILYLTAASYGFAGTQPVTANFSQKNGKNITVQLLVQKHITGSVIFTLSLPRGVNLLESDPPAGKYDRAERELKWLLRGLSPGSHEIKLHLSSDIPANHLNAEIRYLNPVTGKLRIIPVKK